MAREASNSTVCTLNKPIEALPSFLKSFGYVPYPYMCSVNLTALYLLLVWFYKWDKNQFMLWVVVAKDMGSTVLNTLKK